MRAEPGGRVVESRMGALRLPPLAYMGTTSRTWVKILAYVYLFDKKMSR